MKNIDEIVNRHLDEKMDLSKAKQKQEFSKILKVIHSVKTKDQADSAMRLIKNFYKLFSSDKAPGFDMDIGKDESDLMRMLQDHYNKRVKK